MDNSVAKAFRASLAYRQTETKKKNRERIGVDVLAKRFAQGLDLWTGEPLAKTDLAKVEPKE